MKDKRIWLLTLCCMLAVALSLAATPGRAADTAKTYTVTRQTQIYDADGNGYAGTKRELQYQAGQTVTITPTLTVVGKDDVQFQGWEIPDGLTLTEGDKNTETISFVMPERDITLNALYKIVVPLYAFRVANNINGSWVGGSVPAGNHRPVSCGKLEGYQFVAWESFEGLTILEGDKYSENITFLMPAHEVTLKALFTRIDDAFRINGVSVLDNSGAELSAIPKGEFLARVSITNETSSESPLVFFAAYSADGKYQSFSYAYVEASPGATVKVTLPFDNSAGNIAQLKAFAVSSLSDLTIIGTPVSFPAK